MTLKLISYALMTCVLTSLAQGEGELRFEFQPGDKFYLWSVTEQKTSRAANTNQPAAAGQTTELTNKFGCDFDVEEVDENGCAWVKYIYRRTALKVKEQGLDFDFDSGTETKKIHLRALPLLLMLDEGFYVRINSSGRVEKINGLQAVIGSAKSKISGLADSERAWVINTIDETFRESYVRRTLEDLLAVFPESNAPPFAGQSWSSTEKIEERTPQQIIERVFHLKDFSDGITTVDVNIIVSSEVDEIPIYSGTAVAKHMVSGRGRGQVKINLNATGTEPVINSQFTQDSVEQIKVTAQGPVLRLPPVSEPVYTHIVTTFKMTRREPSEPNQPADANY